MSHLYAWAFRRGETQSKKWTLFWLILCLVVLVGMMIAVSITDLCNSAGSCTLQTMIPGFLAWLDLILLPDGHVIITPT
jgi:hypothetical protein